MRPNVECWLRTPRKTLHFSLPSQDKILIFFLNAFCLLFFHFLCFFLTYPRGKKYIRFLIDQRDEQIFSQ